MAGNITIRRARLVLPERVVTGDIVVADGVITDISPRALHSSGEVIDGEGLTVLPGLVDTGVHVDALDDLADGALPFLAGGITSAVGVGDAGNAFEIDAQLDALTGAAGVNYGLLARVGARPADALAARRARGVWVGPELLGEPLAEEVFDKADGLVVVVNQDAQRLQDRWHLFDKQQAPLDLPRVHDVDTCVLGTRRAIELAHRYGTRTHLMHLSTAEETAQLPFTGRVSGSAMPPQLFHDTDAYDRLEARAVCRPPLRGSRHRDALWESLKARHLFMASGHWPVGAWTKEGPLERIHPGWPTAEWWLPHLLDAVNAGRCSLREVAWWTAAAPAQMLGLRRKGRLETGYDGDLVLVDLDSIRTIGESAPIATGAGWSPWLGTTLSGWPVHTIVGGHTAWRDGERGESRGRELA